MCVCECDCVTKQTLPVGEGYTYAWLNCWRFRSRPALRYGLCDGASVRKIKYANICYGGMRFACVLVWFCRAGIFHLFFLCLMPKCLALKCCAFVFSACFTAQLGVKYIIQRTRVDTENRELRLQLGKMAVSYMLLRMVMEVVSLVTDGRRPC